MARHSIFISDFFERRGDEDSGVAAMKSAASRR